MIEAYFIFLKKILEFIPFNTFDYVMVLTLAVYVFEDASFGLIPAGIGFLSTLSAFFIGLAFYHPVSRIIVDKLSLAKGISDAVSFFIVTIVAFVIVSQVLAFVKKKYINLVFPKFINIAGGAVFGSLSFFFIASFAVALLLSFPVSKTIKNSINESVTGRFLSARTQRVEGYVRQIFGGAIEDTINFLTVKPESNETLNLNFRTASYRPDPSAEEKMLGLVNRVRRSAGRQALEADFKLRQVGRFHAKDMVERGYFSHYTPEGLSPFDRMEGANISYQYAGENLALAPDVEIAMDGLMKSPGHRSNILSPNFKKAGIGVIDAGIYGEMFVQEFTD